MPVSPPAPRVEAVVFDLDGTLVDTAPDLHVHLNAVLAEVGRGPATLEAVRLMVGDGSRVLIQRTLAATGGPPNDVELDELVRRFIARYTADPLRLSTIYPGVVEALDALAAGGVRLGVCTNKPQLPTDRLLGVLDLAQRFGAAIGGDALPVRKPDGGHLRAVLDALEVEPAAAVMVGDSRNDVLAARALGVPSVVVEFGYTSTPPHQLGADAVIGHFDQLLPALTSLARAAA